MENKSNMNVVEATAAVLIKFVIIYFPLTIIGAMISEQINGLVHYITFISFTIIVFFTSYIAREQLEPYKNDKNIHISMKTKATLFLLMLGILMADGIITVLISRMFTMESVDLYGENGELIFSIVLCGGILQPIVEEYFFRGKVLKGFLRYGYCPALIASSIAFTIIHFAPEKIWHPFVLGVTTGILLIVTGNIILPTLLHCANNMIAICVDLLVKSELQVETFLVIGLVCFIATLLVICVSKFVRAEIKDVLKKVFKNSKGELHYDKNSCNSGEQ